MQIIYRADSIIDANLVRMALENMGIPAYVSGEYLTGGVGDLPVCGLVNVMVSSVDIDRAKPVVEEISAALSVPVDPADTRFLDDPLPSPG